LTDLFLSRKFILFFPLSPEVGFFVASRKFIWKSKRKVIKDLNFNIVKGAKRLVIAKDRGHDSFVKKHFFRLIKSEELFNGKK
jgi:hypothetical protein